MLTSFHFIFLHWLDSHVYKVYYDYCIFALAVDLGGVFKSAITRKQNSKDTGYTGSKDHHNIFIWPHIVLFFSSFLPFSVEYIVSLKILSHPNCFLIIHLISSAPHRHVDQMEYKDEEDRGILHHRAGTGHWNTIRPDWTVSQSLWLCR